MVALIGLAQFVEWIDRSAFNVLAPDIQKTLGRQRRGARARSAAPFGVLFFARVDPDQHARRPTLADADRRDLPSPSGR